MGRKKGKPWWTEEVKEAVKDKRDAYKKSLERNVPENVKMERKRAYRECKRRVKEAIEESKRRVDEDFGRQLSEKYKRDKKMYWKEVRKEREQENQGSCVGGEVKDVNGGIIREKEAVKDRWKTYFKDLMNVKGESEAIITCMGLEGGGGRVYEQENIRKEEVREAIKNLKIGKAPGVDGITAEMLKYGEGAVIEWMHIICSLAWKEGRVPSDWTKAIIVPVYKGKGSRSECGNYRGISLLSIAGKVYGKIIIERVQQIILRRGLGKNREPSRRREDVWTRFSP